jgi:ribulose kinase
MDVPKALWLHRHERALFDRAAYVCEFQDYLNYHLTGRMVASICNASVRWHYDSRRGGYQLNHMVQTFLTGFRRS